MGPPVPKEVLDPSIDFDAEKRDRFVNSFLASLDSKQNGFISTVEDEDEGMSNHRR
jgi:hypothetical protein